MTAYEYMERVTCRELKEWQALEKIEADEAEKRKQANTENPKEKLRTAFYNRIVTKDKNGR